MKFSNRKEKQMVNEVMASLLCPMKNHLDEKTKICVELTLRALQETEVEEDEGKSSLVK